MRECYVVFKRRDRDDYDRRVIICRGREVLEGEVELGPEDVSLGEAYGTLKQVHQDLDTYELVGDFEDQSNESPIKRVWRILKDDSSFLQDELVSSGDVIEELSQYGMTAWVDADDCQDNTYFEMKVSPEHLPQVELLAAKMYFGPIKLTMIFCQHAYYCTLTEATGEQSFFDDKFPSIASRGSGIQVRMYEDDPVWDKLTLWQVIGDQALQIQHSLKGALAGRAESKTEEKTNTQPDVTAQGETIVDDNHLRARSKDAYEGSYTQTYLMMHPQVEGSMERRALFRYGNWCYAGSLDMDQQVTLGEVPLILRKFQKQQGRLAYICDIKKLPDNLPFSEPMKHFAMANTLLHEELEKAEQVLSDLAEYHKAKGIPPWIDEENGTQYFELQLSGVAAHYEDVELIASKTYYKGVVLISIYFKGSIFLTLSPSVDDQPLLDMSFPDVASQERGLQLASYVHPEYQKLMLWQSRRSVWETANRAVLEQRRLEAMKRKQADAIRQAQEAYEEAMAQADEEDDNSSAYGDEETPASSQVEPEVESKFAETKLEEQQHSTTRSVHHHEQQQQEHHHHEPKFEATTNPHRSSLEQKQAVGHSSGGGARAPHHLKPLGGSGVGALPKLEMSMDAPWDALGRPKALFSKK